MNSQSSTQKFVVIPYKELTLAEFNTIKSLHLQNKLTQIQLNHKYIHKSLNPIANYLINVKSLDITNNFLNESNIAPLIKLVNLKRLNISKHIYQIGNNNLGNNGVQILDKLSNLEYLNLCTLFENIENNKLNGDIIPKICVSFRKLKSLHVGYNKLSATIDNFFHFDHLENLEVLNLCETDINDQYVFQLNKLVNLKQLNLRSNHITDVSIPVIAKMQKLTKLYLGYNKIKDQGVKILADACKNLEQLQLCYNVITDIGGIQISKNLTKLKKLDLKTNKIGNLTFDQIVKNLRQLQYLCLNDNQIENTSALLAIPDGQIKLKILQIQFNRLHKQKDIKPLKIKLRKLNIEIFV